MTAAGSAGSDCIFERLRIEHGYAGGYTVVKDYVRIARADFFIFGLPGDTSAFL